MNTDQYLSDLRNQVKSLPPEEQDDILAEIASHFASASEDPHLGDTPEQRNKHVMAEMGTPGQMGKRLRDVHRPNHLVDLLLIWIPSVILVPLARNLLWSLLGPLPQDISASLPHMYLGIRLSLLIELVLVFAGWRRRSAVLSVFWLTQAIGMAVSLITREGRWVPGQEVIPGSIVETFVLYTLLAALIFWLVRTLRENRFDLLLVVFALQPLLLMGANVAMVQLFDPASIPQQTVPFQIPAGSFSFLFYQVGWGLGLSIFVLFNPRDVRWFGLLWASLTYAYPTVFQYWASFPVAILWSTHTALVVLAWALDVWGRRSNRPLVE
jgi:hypothetical protein